MEQPLDASADSSPAPLSSTDYLESLSESDRQKFFEGSAEDRSKAMSAPESKRAKPIKAEKPAASAESAPAPAEGQEAASTDASSKAASEPAAPAKETKGLDAREQEIRQRQAALKDALAEVARQERELSERQARLNTPPAKQDATPESSPAAAKKAFERYAADPRAPKLEQFETYDAWAMEMMDFISDRKLEARDTEQRRTHEQQQHQRELETAVQTSSQRVKAFAEKTPDFQTRVNPDLLNIVPISALKDGDAIGPHNFIAEQMWRSEFPGEFALHFSEHPEDFRALMQLNHPDAIVRRMGRIEASFIQPEGQSRDSKPVPKTIPDADELPAVIGRKAPVTASGLESAVVAKDFAAYEREWKRERGIKD